MDQYTADWIKTQAEAFNYEGQTSRAWSRNELGTRNLYQGFLHSNYWWNKRGPSILAKIQS